MKTFYKIIVCVLILSLLPVNIFGAETDIADENVIYFEDGSYIVITISSIETRATNVRIGTKDCKYFNSNNVTQWTLTITGSFTYNGFSSTCNGASYTVEIENDNWYEISGSAGRSGSTAVAEVTMGQKWLGIKIKEETMQITLTCDANGNLS